MSDEIAYRELKRGEVIQEGDEWKTESGRWALFHQSMIGQTAGVRARRPYNITQIQIEQLDTGRTVTTWQIAAEAALSQRDEARAALHVAQSQCDALRNYRDMLRDSVDGLFKRNQCLTAELARLQQPPSAADHIADASKMVESELERKAWELYSRLDLDEEEAFRQAEYFITERNRRRQAGMTTTDVAGD